MELNFDKNKYLSIAQKKGYSSAVTALHNDLAEFDFDTFDGPNGFKPLALAEMAEIRNFSREIWEMALRDTSGKAQ